MWSETSQTQRDELSMSSFACGSRVLTFIRAFLYGRKEIEALRGSHERGKKNEASRKNSKHEI